MFVSSGISVPVQDAAASFPASPPGSGTRSPVLAPQATTVAAVSAAVHAARDTAVMARAPRRPISHRMAALPSNRRDLTRSLPDRHRSCEAPAPPPRAPPCRLLRPSPRASAALAHHDLDLENLLVGVRRARRRRGTSARASRWACTRSCSALFGSAALSVSTCSKSSPTTSRTSARAPSSPRALVDRRDQRLGRVGEHVRLLALRARASRRARTRRTRPAPRACAHAASASAFTSALRMRVSLPSSASACDVASSSLTQRPSTASPEELEPLVVRARPSRSRSSGASAPPRSAGLGPAPTSASR